MSGDVRLDLTVLKLTCFVCTYVPTCVHTYVVVEALRWKLIGLQAWPPAIETISYS